MREICRMTSDNYTAKIFKVGNEYKYKVEITASGVWVDEAYFFNSIRDAVDYIEDWFKT